MRQRISLLIIAVSSKTERQHRFHPNLRIINNSSFHQLGNPTKVKSLRIHYGKLSQRFLYWTSRKVRRMRMKFLQVLLRRTQTTSFKTSILLEARLFKNSKIAWDLNQAQIIRKRNTGPCTRLGIISYRIADKEVRCLKQVGLYHRHHLVLVLDQIGEKIHQNSKLKSTKLIMKTPYFLPK